MKLKTSDLQGTVLDWAVAKCNGHVDDETIIRRLDPDEEGWCIAYSTDWAQGGPIIERENIELKFLGYDNPPHWGALKFTPSEYERRGEVGPTPLIAAMRCFVASHLGDEVEVPVGLVA